MFLWLHLRLHRLSHIQLRAFMMMVMTAGKLSITTIIRITLMMIIRLNLMVMHLPTLIIERMSHAGIAFGKDNRLCAGPVGTGIGMVKANKVIMAR